MSTRVAGEKRRFAARFRKIGIASTVRASFLAFLALLYDQRVITERSLAIFKFRKFTNETLRLPNGPNRRQLTLYLSFFSFSS